MNIEETCDKVVALQSGIFKLIQENDSKRYILEQKLNGLKEKFNKIKGCYNEEVRKISRYDLEYIFLFEQYNLNRLILEADIKKNELYGKRLKKLSEHIYNRKIGRVLDVKRTFYEFNGLVQTEMVNNYEFKIQTLKQKKIMANKYDVYLGCLRKADYQEYLKKSSLAYSKEEKEIIDNGKDELREEQKVVVGVLSQKFDITDDVIMSMQLASPDIVAVAQKMYPDLEGKMSQLKDGKKVESAVVVQFPENENSNSRKVA